jgi:hypothetical protein
MTSSGSRSVRRLPGDLAHRGAKASPGEQLYTADAPQVIQNKPGNCPICGMKLTPVRKQPNAERLRPTRSRRAQR